MRAYVSGEAARGALVSAGKITGYVMDVAEAVDLERQALTAFFLSAMDVEPIECDSSDQLKEKIENAWANDRAVRLLLISIDSSQRLSTRMEAASCVNEFFESTDCQTYAANQLYSRPLPSKFDGDEVLRVISSAEAPLVERFIELLIARQESITSCTDAWERIPEEVFSDQEEREAIRLRIVNTGAFYNFAAKGDGDNFALFRLLADPLLAGKAAKIRDIFRFWASRYKEMPKSSRLTDADLEGDWGAEFDDEKGAKSNYAAYLRVIKQLDEIKRKLRDGNAEKAIALVEELISYQRSEGSDEHIAKSLCQLAVFAKSMGDTDLCYQFAERATREAPTDAWSYAQLGSSLLEKGEYLRAVDAFGAARKFGDERAALIGMAETQKYLGHEREALELLDECIERYPLDNISQNARAAVLAYFGRLERSLVDYRRITASPLADAYSFGGMSAVLSDLGRMDEAVAAIDSSIYLSPGSDPIPFCAKADMFREAGLYGEAARVLDGVPSHLAGSLQIENTRSRILRDSGDFDAAYLVLKRTTEKYPRDIYSRFSLAELLRKTGKNDLALAAYEEMEGKFPRHRFTRNTLAALYGATYQYERALASLSTHAPATKGDWVGQHIRALVLMKLGHFDQAKELVMQGLRNCPWPAQQPYFSSALALINLSQADSLAAVRVLLPHSETPALQDAAAFLTIARLHAFASGGDEEGLAAAIATGKGLSIPVLAEFIQYFEPAYCAAANAAEFLSSEEFRRQEWRAVMALAA